jgi:hypothetical protein
LNSLAIRCGSRFIHYLPLPAVCQQVAVSRLDERFSAAMIGIAAIVLPGTLSATDKFSGLCYAVKGQYPKT